MESELALCYITLHLVGRAFAVSRLRRQATTVAKHLSQNHLTHTNTNGIYICISLSVG